MEHNIRHEGIIESIDDGHIKVRILQTSACASCKIATHCPTSEAKEKIIDVTASNAHWQVGQSVVVCTKGHMAGKALLIGFGIPLIIMLLTLVVMTAAGYSEGTTALVMLGVLIPYYFIVWMMRKHIANAISFQLEETN